MDVYIQVGLSASTLSCGLATEIPRFRLTSVFGYLLVLTVLFDVIESQSQDFHNHFEEDLGPIKILLFWFHKNDKELKG